MMRARFSAAAGLALLATTGCPAPPTTLARAQDLAQEFNLDARFGRTEQMVELVAPNMREQWSAHHHPWGNEIRVADVEFAGTKPHGDRELEFFVRFSWYRADENQLRVTTIRQTWRDAGGWHLAAEERLDGDYGLLGDAAAAPSPSAEEARPRTQFPTVHLTGRPQ